MYLKFKKHIKENLPFLLEGKSLIAVSGGIDSVLLTYLCKDAGLNVALAHCNFNLRGEESDKDQQFVEALGLKLNIEVFVQEFDTENFAKSNKISIQMAARELRYEWFDELSSQLDFDYLLTAHHADDNLETFLINLSRGSGLEGLTGIPEINGNIVRPLLPFSRNEIEGFANEMKIGWREDKSNTDTKYLRNKLRQDIIPILKEINPQLLEGFSRSAAYLKEAEAIIEDRLDNISEEILDVSDEAIYLDVQGLRNLNNPKAYLYFLLKDYGFTAWNDVANLLDAQSGSQVFSKNWRLLKDRNKLILSRNTNLKNDQILIEEGTTYVNTPSGILSFQEVEKVDKFDIESNAIYVDRDTLLFPLVLRKWEEGDFFYPLGMKGKKKLSKYFKDEKFSLIAKEKALLLCSGDDIVWILGHRADNRFKITKTTENVLQITFD